jgi:HEAT repeat protein
MPFVKHNAPAAAPEPAPALLDMAALDAADAAQRRGAALALAGDAGAVAALMGRLQCESEPNVRAALFTSLAAAGGPGTAALITPFLHSDDPGVRAGAIDALKSLAAEAAAAIDALLDNPDADLRLLAIEVVRDWPALLATPRLLRVLVHDSHVNVCAAALDVAAETGTAELLGALKRLRRRFPDQPFIHFAANVALARIQALVPARA